ncbi:unnamed protein product [Notodromas monacha]|uniref:Uncharacterized protein n=1 Tax=Notodromas monacha TaxID=399045 RepID=A0A7R9C1L8_9CRUS|nr:unnamed protein product [Notodromas monacha]CAG0925730.1 unnamed protein product [Notodromas monacha]
MVPLWKRQMLARKLALQAKVEAGDEFVNVSEVNTKLGFVPDWKQQLLDRTTLSRRVPSTTTGDESAPAHIFHVATKSG